MSPSPPFVWDSFSDHPFLWRPWQFWGVPVRYFIEWSSIWVCEVFSPWLSWDYGFLRGRLQIESDILISYRGYMLSTWLSLMTLSLMTWLFLSGFSTMKLLPLSFPDCTLWKVEAHTSGEGRYAPPLEGAVSTYITWNSSAQEICLFSLINLFM